MAEFFGDLERLAADLYPWRYLIGVGVLIAVAAIAAFGYRKGLHLWAWQHRLPVALIGIPLLALVGFMAYDLGSPLFTNVTVEEEFPFAFSAIVPLDMSRDDVEQTMFMIAKIDQEAVNEPMPDMAMASPTQESVTPLSQAAPVKLKEGSFRDADSFHKGSGTATIYRGSDGTLLLRLEDFKVTNGPELHVILSPHQNPESQKDLKAPGYVDLGKLKGNIGNQNYPIPDSVDIAALGSVVIYCSPFHVIFSVASLGGTG